MSCPAGKDDRGPRSVAPRTRRAARTLPGRGEQYCRRVLAVLRAAPVGALAPDVRTRVRGPDRGGRASVLSVLSDCPRRCAGFSRSWLRRWCGTARESCHGRMAGRLWPTTRCSGSGPLRRGHGGVEERSEPGGAEEVHAGQNDDDGSPVGLQHRKLSVGSPCPGLAACHWHPTNTTAAPASRSISSPRSSPTSTSGVPSRSCRAVTENRTGAAAGSDGGAVVERGTRSTSRSLMESAPAIMPATTAGTSGVRVRADRVGHPSRAHRPDRPCRSPVPGTSPAPARRTTPDSARRIVRMCPQRRSRGYSPRRRPLGRYPRSASCGGTTESRARAMARCRATSPVMRSASSDQRWTRSCSGADW
jgi:hypothetical protein